MFRHQLPVHSPLPLRAVLAAFAGGDPREALASELRDELGVARVVLTDSGTTALTLALRAAAARRPGLPCALPAYACYDLATAAIGAGVDVVLYDLDPATLGPDEASLRAACANGVAAVVAVHLYGVPVAMDRVCGIAHETDAIVIEDAAQGTGALRQGRPVGAEGDLGVLSFGRGKGVTGGGGGALLFRDTRTQFELAPISNATVGPEFAIKLAAQWALGRPAIYGIPSRMPFLRLGETVYRPPRVPAAMSPAEARVLLQTRPGAANEADARGKRASRLLRAAQDADLRTVAVLAETVAGWLRFPVVLSPTHRAHSRADARLGILPGYPVALSALPELAPALHSVSACPGAERLARDLWTLPTHGQVSECDLNALERWLISDAAVSS